MALYKDNLTFYVVPSWKCNLHCPHCFVNNLSENVDKEKFLQVLKQCKQYYPNAGFILHGGEPTFDKDLLIEILNLNIITSITTNLMYIDNEINDVINKSNISVATSWNSSRFELKKHRDIWFNNLKQLKEKPLLLITLDKDLVRYKPIEIVDIIKDIPNIDRVLFEPLLDNSLNDEFQDIVDNWLCELHKVWNIGIKNIIEEQILNWNFACNSKTILPNGTIHNKCTMADASHKPVFLNKCLKCKYNKVCIPCSLHTRCSFYPKFYELIKGENDA